MKKALALYSEDKIALTELSFIKDLPNQMKIRDISGYEISKEFGKLWPIIITGAGIKGELDSFTKNDIKEMILMRFKGLSVNEIAYAFKMERYGLLGDRIEHFQLFDASYVEKVLGKYVEWKKEFKIEHKITPALPEPSIPEEVKIKRRNSAIRKAWEHFLKTFGLLDGYVFIYEELMKSGFLNDDLEFKKEIHKSAIEVLKLECQQETADPYQKQQYKHILNNLTTPKFTPVIIKCKELSILSFFRQVKKDEKLLETFKEKYDL